MNTKYFVVDRDNPDKNILAQGANILKNGGLVAFPTETVYGLGANGLDSQAVAKIYQAKGRPSDNPLILHIANSADLVKLVAEIPANAKALIDEYWPGPLTVVLKKAAGIPNNVTGGLDTVAVRLPASVVARELITLAGVPVAAPSANTSGRPSPTGADAVLNDLNGRIDAVIDAGACEIGVESTVVDCTTPVPTLLRPGGLTMEMLIDTLGEVEVDAALGGEEGIRPRAPGMKYKHYAPLAPMTLFEGDYEKIKSSLTSTINKSLSSGEKVGALVSRLTAKDLPSEVKTVVYGARDNAAEVAANLYEALRSFDNQDVDVIYAEGISEEGLGLAVMNRMRKASGYKIIK